MKKFLTLTLVILFLVLFVESANALVSTDMSEYVRRDVFDAKMEAFMAEIRLGNQNLLEQIRGEMDRRFAELDKRFDEIDKRFVEVDKRFDEIDKRFVEVDKRFSEVDKRLSDLNDRFNILDKKVDVLAERTDGIKTTVYWGLGFFGIIVALSPQFSEYMKKIRKPVMTVEDVEKIVERTLERLIAAQSINLAGK